VDSATTDEALLSRVQSGDMTAFDALYARYETRLFSYLRALLADRRDAEEVFHDAFMKSLDADATTFKEGGFRPWLYKVARNLALNRLRDTERAHKKHAAAEEVRVSHGPDGATDAEDALHARQVAAALDSAVHRLPPALYELYHLRASGLTNEQIAELVAVPVGTVKSRFFQMIVVLRKELSPWIAP
jgi:RNA polymerase sigma-70 factor (ECF subfamily)